jgi:hypothetical protein
MFLIPRPWHSLLTPISNDEDGKTQEAGLLIMDKS